MDSEKLIYDLLRAPRFASSPDAGHGEAGIIIDPDPVGGGLIVYTATDTYDAELATGTYHFKLGMDGSVSIVNASLTLSGTGSYIAIGATPPTSSSAGTGIWIDYTGIYGLASNVKQFYLNAADGTAYAGAGVVTIDSTGISIISGTDAANRITWTLESDPTKVVAYINAYSSSGSSKYIYIQGGGAPCTTAQVFLNSEITGDEGYLRLESSASKHSVAMYSEDGAGTFYGLLIDATNGRGAVADHPSSLLHLVSTAPTFRMEDTTASAKSLLVTTNANSTTFAEVTGGTIFSLDLANLNIDIADANDITLGSTTGTKIGTATTQKLGFYNATPVVRQGAYTQTYATADKTHANLTAAALTDNSGGTANQTVAAVSGSGDDTTINNNFADVTAQINKLITDLTDVKQLANSIIDDLQAYGLAA